MSSRSSSAAVFLFSVAITLSGCMQAAPPPLPHRPLIVKSIVSLSPSTTELCIYCMPFLVGRTQADNYPPTVAGVPVMTTGTKPDYELIASVKPDVIVYDKDLYSASDLDKLKPVTREMVGIGGDTVAEWTNDVMHFASVAMGETTYNDYIDRVFREIQRAKGDPLKSTPKVAMVMATPNGSPFVAGVDSFYADLMRQAGGNPVGPSAHKFVKMTMEELIAAKPDIIVVPGPKGDYSSVTKDPQLSQLPAVKSGHVLGIESDVVLRRGARVDQAIKELHDGFGKLVAR